jgi:hypothetical protein
LDNAVALNPVSSARTVYVPVGNCGATYSPNASVTTVRLYCVPSFVRTTLAPATTAPVESVTVPRMVPATV